MSKEKTEQYCGVYVPDTCRQTVRPMSNLLNAIAYVQENIDRLMFDFLFDEKGGMYYKKFEQEYHRNIISFWNDLPSTRQWVLSNYIESVTPVYNVEKHLRGNDVDILMNCNKYMIPVILKDMNYSKYGGTIDENATLIWVNRKRNKEKK